MTPTFSIRPAEPRDVDAIAGFNVRLAAETEHLSLDLATVRSGVARGLSRAVYLVATADVTGEVVGQLMLTREWSDWRDADIWWLQSVYVRQDWRGRRVFASLLERAAQLAQLERVACLRLYVEKQNAVAQEVYRRLRFHDAGYVVMERDLRVERDASVERDVGVGR
jgi:GNAT superfamily N-acetyltransferase